MTFDLPDGGPLLAGPEVAGGNATIGGTDSRPRVAVISDLTAPRPDADLYLVRPVALIGRHGGRELRRLRRQIRPALLAGPSSPDGDFERWSADVLVLRPGPDPAQTAREALRGGVRAAGRPVLVDVSELVAADSIIAAIDAGAAGVVIDTGDEAADAALLGEVAEQELSRLENAPLMTVAICVRNAAADLDRCLASLRTLRYPRFEVLVCDDGSTDASPAVARRYGARVLELGKVGRGRARNIAINEGLGDYIAFLDSDEEAGPDWLSRLWRLHDRLGAAVVGGPNRQFPDAPWQERAVGGAPGVAMPVVRGDGSCTHVPACNLSANADLARDTGFHEQLNFGEDLDFCYRVLDAGQEILFHPTASVLHHRRRSLRGYVEQMWHYGRYARTFEIVHRGRLVEIPLELTPLQRLDPRRPHPCFVGPQADQRYNLAFAPLTNGFPLKVLLATLAGSAVILPAAALAGRLRPALAFSGVMVAGQLAYVLIRAPAQPTHGVLRAAANRVLTAGLWYVGPAAVQAGRRLNPLPQDALLGPVPESSTDAQVGAS
jgi:GT2 family glycosyltransferase